MASPNRTRNGPAHSLSGWSAKWAVGLQMRFNHATSSGSPNRLINSNANCQIRPCAAASPAHGQGGQKFWLKSYPQPLDSVRSALEAMLFGTCPLDSSKSGSFSSMSRSTLVCRNAVGRSALIDSRQRLLAKDAELCQYPNMFRRCRDCPTWMGRWIGRWIGRWFGHRFANCLRNLILAKSLSALMHNLY